MTTTGPEGVTGHPVGPVGPVGPADPDAGAAATREEQARAEAGARLRRGRLVTAAVVGVLVLVLGVVALLGGFRARTDLLTPVTAGSLIVSGPYEVTLDRATVQHRLSPDGWQVVATGTARTTGAASIEPPVGESSGFVFAKDVAGGEVQASSTITLGVTDELDSLANLTPGLPPVPWRVQFTFTREPGDTLLVVVFDQEYTSPYVFGDEMAWRPTDHAATLRLPLQRLPDQG